MTIPKSPLSKDERKAANRERSRRIWELAVAGKSEDVIALELGLYRGTVRRSLANRFRQYGIYPEQLAEQLSQVAIVNRALEVYGAMMPEQSEDDADDAGIAVDPAAASVALKANDQLARIAGAYKPERRDVNNNMVYKWADDDDDDGRSGTD